MLRARPVLIALTLTALPLLAACGDDEEPDPTPTTTAEATTEATTEATSTPTEAATESSTPEATETATESPTSAATETAAAGGGGEERTSTIASFTLETFSVPAGTTVTWQNDDSAPHTATASDGSFDSGSLDQGQTFSHTFEAAGTFEYACAIHPTMTGTVTVE